MRLKCCHYAQTPHLKADIVKQNREFQDKIENLERLLNILISRNAHSQRVIDDAVREAQQILDA